MPKEYTHLTMPERDKITVMLSEKKTFGDIAKESLDEVKAPSHGS